MLLQHSFFWKKSNLSDSDSVMQASNPTHLHLFDVYDHIEELSLLSDQNHLHKCLEIFVVILQDHFIPQLARYIYETFIK